MTAETNNEQKLNEAGTPLPRGSMCIVEIKRRISFMPYRTETQTYRFSSQELAEVFQENYVTITRLEEERAELERSQSSDFERIRLLEKRVTEAEKLFSKNKRLEGTVQKLNNRIATLSNEVGHERRKKESSQSSLRLKERDLQRMEKSLVETQRNLDQATTAFEELEQTSRESLRLLDEKKTEALIQLKQCETALDLVSKVRAIPYGVERVLEKVGKTVAPPTNLPSHPPLSGPSVGHHRTRFVGQGWVLNALCLAKDRTNVKTSQDALAFEIRCGELHAAIADGVSSSHRQAEWAHRVARAALDDDALAGIVRAQQVHSEHAKTLFDLVDPKLQWMEEDKMNNPGQATLLRVESHGDSITMQRCGDTWAAVYHDGAWNVVLSPSNVAATTAISSDQPPTFDDTLTILKPERMLVMTDGVLGQLEQQLEQLWDGLAMPTDEAFVAWLESADRADLFDPVDDVTALAISFEPEDTTKGLEGC